MLQILFEWFEFVSNASNPIGVVGICIRMLWIHFEYFKFAFQCSNGLNLFWMLRIPLEWVVRICIRKLQIHSNGSIFHSNFSNPVWMVQISLQMVWIPFKWFKFVFECFESHSNSWNLHLNVWNPLRMTQICIPKLRIPCEWFKFACKSFKFHSNGSNFYSNVLNHVRMFRMNWMQILTIQLGFEAFECKFQLFEHDSKHSNMIRNIRTWFETFDSNASNPFRMVRICILNSVWVVQSWLRILQIPFEWFEFEFKSFKSHSNGSYLHSNASNPIRIVGICLHSNGQICIRMVWNSFKWFEFGLEWFESRSSGSNLHSNASNPIGEVRICIRKLQIPFEWFELAFKCFESCLNGSNGSNLYSNAWHPVWMVQISIWVFWILF